MHRRAVGSPGAQQRVLHSLAEKFPTEPARLQLQEEHLMVPRTRSRQRPAQRQVLPRAGALPPRPCALCSNSRSVPAKTLSGGFRQQWVAGLCRVFTPVLIN